MRKTRMEVMSRIYDKRINSTNLYVTTTFKEYLSIAGQLIKNNELQRKKGKNIKNRIFAIKDGFDQWLCDASYCIGDYQ